MEVKTTNILRIGIMAPNEKGGEEFIEVCRIVVNEAIIEFYERKQGKLKKKS